MIRRINNFEYNVSADHDDMRRYLQWRVETDVSLRALLRKKDGLQDQIFDAIVRNAGAMFLMAKLITDALATSLTIKELKSSLEKIPTGLHVAYDATMRRIVQQGQTRSQRAFEVMKWVLSARCLLSSEEMEHAVSIGDRSDDIDVDDIVPASTLVSLCAGLVVRDEYGDFRFLHQTVPEYLKMNHTDMFCGADTSVADSCLTYLMYEVFSNGPCADLSAFQDRSSRYPLYSYCSRYWYKHFNGAPNDAPNDDQKRLALQFFRNESRWRSARQAATSSPSELGNFLTPQRLREESVLHHAAHLDAHHLFEELVKDDPLSVNNRNGLRRTPLMRAAVHGSHGFAGKLIRAGAEIDVSDADGNTALDLAVWKEDFAMIDLLVTNPSFDIHLRDAKTKKFFCSNTAFISAAGNGASAIVRRLIEAGADVNTFNEAGFSALHLAAMNDHPQIVEMLVATPSIDIHSRTRKYEILGYKASPMMIAASRGHIDTVKVLLQAGGDRGDAAMHLAVLNGHAAVVEALLDSGFESYELRQISALGNDCLSALMLATLAQSVQLLKTLLARGNPNVNLQSSRGKTALIVAVKANKIEAAKILLSNKTINVNVADDDGWTTLMAAADIGLVEIIPDLVAKGANVNVRSSGGWTPILLAADGNHTAVVELLSSSEGILLQSSGTSEGRTALHYAVAWANVALVNHLLTRRVNPEIRDTSNNFKAVDYARYFNDKNILALLEANGEETTI